MLMLICFGVSWPISIAKTLKTKNVAGKSIIFLYIIIFGYICGIIHKIFNNFNWVTYLYGLNAFMVSIDAFLWHKYNKKKNLKTILEF